MYVATSRILLVFHGCVHIRIATCTPWICPYQECYLYSMDVSASRLLMCPHQDYCLYSFDVSKSRFLLVFHGCVHIKNATFIPWMCPYQDCYFFHRCVHIKIASFLFFQDNNICFNLLKAPKKHLSIFFKIF